MLSGHASLSSCPWVLLEDLSSVYTDVEVERKHTHKKRKLADGREKTMVSLMSYYYYYYISICTYTW